MNIKHVLAGACAGFAAAAALYLVYPSLHSALPTPLALKITALVQAIRKPGDAPEAPRAQPSPPRKAPAREEAAGKTVKRAPGQPKPYYGDLPSLAAVNVRDAQLDVIYKGLEFPWSMEFADRDTLLIAEQGGSLQRLDLGTGQLSEISGLPYIPPREAQLGLLDIALHPAFGDNGRIYFSHSVHDPESNRYTTALSTAVIDGDRLRELQQLLVATPFAKSKSNFGGAIAFDDAGYLYFATGDKSVNRRSQNPRFLNGKILRLHDDGRIPEDNPFVGRAGVRPEIYALGVRNPQGLVFDSRRGLLYETEHGPMGGDEVNIIRAGANYGWPSITYGRNYTDKPIGVGSHADGLEQPLYYYLPSIAASPIEIYSGDMFPEWQGHLLVGALKGAHVSKLDITDGGVRSHQRILDEAKGRVRDIKVAEDGSLFLLVQNGGRLLRLHRPPREQTAEVRRGERLGPDVYNMVCVTCHGNGTPGVPQRDDRAARGALLAKGRATLYRNTIEGVGAMPERGLCEDCTDEELRRAVDYMLGDETAP